MEVGDQICILESDDQPIALAVLHDLWAEWDGKRFAGCITSSGETVRWTYMDLRRQLLCARRPDGKFNNIHGMIEQLIASGELPG